MRKEARDLTSEEVVDLLKDGEEVLSGGLIHKVIEGSIHRIDSNGHSTAIGADIETFARMHHCYLPREYFFSIFDLEHNKEYYAEKCDAVYRRRENEIEYQTPTGEWKGACFHAGVPKFCPVIVEEYLPESWEKAERIEQVLDIVKKVQTVGLPRQDRWSWIKNPSCKYIEVRFDMRDGDFVLLNRALQRISIEELRKQ